ncbi:GILT-like protein 1 [Hyposmocoma kahamanoa]|uniref:GILT-like protein 1 n=1 Tax=Hyposmocoma kahamanoa TaxID=1477025 RepID=UPI000E6D906A|nr:GILT-like protein 1 [Hyposmocoma kahamanoa]
MAKFLYILVCFSVVSNYATATNLEVVNGKIKITVGTTSRCGDTIRFITQELAPTYQAYKQFLTLEFVPWGRTTYASDGTMTCQFGPTDCFANRVHRCALNMLRGDQDAQMSYMNCEFTSPFPATTGSFSCGQDIGLNLRELEDCVYITGVHLDQAAQEAAREPMRIINFVPSIHFNDVIDRNLHNQGFRGLRSLVCSALANDQSTGVTNCV